MLVLATSMADTGESTSQRSQRQVRIPSPPPLESRPLAAKADAVAPEPRSELPRAVALPEAPLPPAQQAAATPGDAAIRVEQSTQSAAERNQMEVQRAAELLRRGSPAEAETGLRGVLANDKGMVAARLALVSLLQRQQRTDEARQVLRDGVALAPTQAALVLPYARLLAARYDWNGAWEALQPASEALAQDAEYRGLCGVVLQRLGRYPQSVNEYRAALKLSPAASAWWVGLGLSLEGDAHPAEARAAYLQARASNPAPDLAQFIEGKLARLSGVE